MLKLDAAGGRLFFHDYGGENDTTTGSADWLMADGLKFSDHDALLPSLNGRYSRSSQVNQIGGGGTLVTQSLDDTAGLRWIRSFGAWALKPNASYKSELATIDSQEDLGAGLFDFGQESAGAELEWTGQGALKSVRQDFSVSNTDYYHYQPGRSPLFGAELLSNGRDLNFISYGYTATADLAPWAGGLLSASLGGSYLDYGDQKVVEGDTGAKTFTITSRARQDWMGNFVASITQKLPDDPGGLPVTGSATLSLGFTALRSNQNDVDKYQSDSSVFKFNPDYYSYDEFSAGPLVSLVVAGKLRMSFSYNFARRDYLSRPVQNGAGNYLGGNVYTDTHTLAYSASYPVWPSGLSAQISGGYVASSSNMAFENFYLYNYSYPYAFAGLSYAL